MAAVLVGDFLVGGRRARAAEPREVEALIGEGMDLRRQGKDERALPFFQKAYGIEHTPRTAGQLGLAEMAVGYWLSAESHLVEALDSPGHPWISKNQPTLASALERVRKRIGEVTITGSPAGARVVLNGQDVGVLPLGAPVRVGEGRVQVELSARGYVTTSKTFHLAGGDKERIAVGLAPAATVPAAMAPVTEPAPPRAPAPAAIPSPASPSAAANGTAAPMLDQGPSGSAKTDSTSAGRTAAYVTGGVAAAALIFAIVETVQWRKKQSDFETYMTVSSPPGNQTNCGEGDPGRGATGCQQIYDAAVRAWKLSLVGYGLTGVLGATALYLYLSSETSPGARSQTMGEHAQKTAVRCLPSMGLGGIASAGMNCGLRF